MPCAKCAAVFATRGGKAPVAATRRGPARQDRADAAPGSEIMPCTLLNSFHRGAVSLGKLWGRSTHGNLSRPGWPARSRPKPAPSGATGAV